MIALLLALNAKSLFANENGSPARGTEERWITFAVNCHDWVNPELSADAITFVMDSLEAVGARAEFYVTAPLVDAWAASRPEFLERLQSSDHTISYHLRPPHPAYFSPTASLLESATLVDYERYRLRLDTGTLDRKATGGLSRVQESFGVPSACGTAGATEELGRRFAAHMAARGVRMGVFDHGPVAGLTGHERLLQPEVGLYPRPNDYFVARTNSTGVPVESGGNFWWNWVASIAYSPESLAEALRMNFLEGPGNPDHSPRFAVVIIHEDNFYTSGTPWEPIYFESDGTPKAPPYDLSLGEVGATRSPEEQARIRAAWVAMVQAAASDPETRIVTSRELSALADAQFDGNTVLQRTEQWNVSGGFSPAPPAPHDWRLGAQTQGSFSIASDAGESGAGLRITANSGGAITVQQRVDIDKGRLYTFGARIKGSSVGSASLRIVAVNRNGDTLTEVPNTAAATAPASGTFDWTTASNVRYIAANFDYLLLQVRLTGGGTLLVDDCRVESEETAALAFPPTVAQPVDTAILIHIEDTPALTADTPYFRAKTKVLQDVAGLIATHGGRMTLQPELDLALGCMAVPGYGSYISDLHEKLGVEFSLHTHGPDPGSTFAEVLAYLAERKNTYESLGSGTITDLNGNFDVEDWSMFEAAGVTSMTAFKNTQTQGGYAGRYFHPWRPSPGNPMIDEAAWAIDNPASQVVYLPGNTTQVTRYSYRLRDNLLPGLTAALWNTDPLAPTTFYFVMHVDAFDSLEGGTVSDYMSSAEYASDLARYDEFFGEVLVPLSERGLLRFSTPQGMHRRFLDSLVPGNVAGNCWMIR